MHCDTSQGTVDGKSEGKGREERERGRGVGREGEEWEERMWTQCLHNVLVYVCVHTGVMASDAPLPNNVHTGFFSPDCRRE